MLALADLIATLGGVVLGYLFLTSLNARLIQPMLAPALAKAFGISESRAELLTMSGVVAALATLGYLLPAP